MPTYNEALSLPSVLPGLVDFCKKRRWNLIVVNDGSTDSSIGILNSLRRESFISIVHHKLNQGYGGALKSGIRLVNTPYCITIDADGQHKFEDIELIFKFARENDADMVIGSRDNLEYVDWYREFGKWLIRKFTSLLVPLQIKDLNSGFKLYRTRLIQRYIYLCPDSMAFSDVITLLFINQRLSVLEYPIIVNQRLTGNSSINTYTAFQTLIEIVNLVMLVNPLRIFLPLSVFCILSGLIWEIPIMFAGRGVSVGSMLAIVLGCLFFFLGLIASQLSAIRIQLANLSIKNTDKD